MHVPLKVCDCHQCILSSFSLIFCPILIGLLTEFWESFIALYVLDISPSIYRWLTNFILQSLDYFFILRMSFEEQNFCILITYDLLQLSFYGPYILVYFSTHNAVHKEKNNIVKQSSSNLRSLLKERSSRNIFLSCFMIIFVEVTSFQRESDVKKLLGKNISNDLSIKSELAILGS